MVEREAEVKVEHWNGNGRAIGPRRGYCTLMPLGAIQCGVVPAGAMQLWDWETKAWRAEKVKERQGGEPGCRVRKADAGD